MVKRTFFLYFFLSPFFLFAEVPIDEVVEMRGFIVKDEEGRYYLVDRPLVRSCCVQKLQQKILLEGDVGTPPAYSVATFKGVYVPESGGKLILRK